MLSLCKPCIPSDVAGMDLQALASAGSDAKQLAEETSQRCVITQERGQTVMGYAEEIKSTLGQLSNKMNPSSFMTIMNLLQDDKMNTTISLAKEMDTLALECVDKTNEMSTVMQRGVNSFPEELVSKASEDDDVEDTDGDNEPEISGFEKDISELEECTEGLRSMNLLTATTKGVSAFDGLVSKGQSCETLFGRIKDLCASVARLAQSLMMDGCCAQVKAGAACLKDMMKSLKLSNLIKTLAQLGRRLIEAFVQLLQVAWEKFGNFLKEFEASKKLKNFMSGLNPFQGANQDRSLMESFIPGSSSSTTGMSMSSDLAPQTNALCCL